MIILGDTAVGKSSILDVFTGNPFVFDQVSTAGIDFTRANHTLKDGI